ncbi:hypothetical protein ACFRJ9_01865 [Paenarthrobacter sp. NPDC056912]|uniref:hypothetical protein n=1 Tax=Paenarthrobacter sp. NPDC056912 TaxID=3345965 RepID=UPI00366F8249
MSRLPRFDLHLAPMAGEGLHVSYRAELAPVAGGTALLRIPLTMVSVPFPPYTAADLTVMDDDGELVLVGVDEEPTPMGQHRSWSANRATVGALTVSYFAPVRHVDESSANGPLFDLRGEDRGVIGSGMGFLVLPVTEEEFDIGLRWRSNGHGYAAAVSSRGEGDQTWKGRLETLAFCTFAAGDLRRYPAWHGDDPSKGPVPDLAMYWLSDPPFDTDAVGSYIASSYANMATFFQEEERNYRVFIRANPFKGTGGTAMPQSFTFGYNRHGSVDAEELRTLLSHEMAHNWPKLDGEHGDTAWYSEGTAEYYSLLLQYRGGALDVATLVHELNSRTSGYLTNPLHVVNNREAAEQFWQDSRAQRIPYGRGLLYLIAVDGRIRLASDGRKCLDDVVLDILRTQRNGGTVTLDGWVERVAAHIGPDARAMFEHMVSGADIEIPGTAFDGAVAATATLEHTLELGFDHASFKLTPRVVRGLDASSAAASAGLREGDALRTAGVPTTVMNHNDAELELDIIRDGETLTVRFWPRGHKVPSLRWAATGQAQP